MTTITITSTPHSLARQKKNALTRSCHLAGMSPVKRVGVGLAGDSAPRYWFDNTGPDRRQFWIKVDGDLSPPTFQRMELRAVEPGRIEIDSVGGLKSTYQRLKK